VVRAGFRIRVGVKVGVRVGVRVGVSVGVRFGVGKGSRYQQAPEQLLLQPLHGHGEVDHGELREGLGRVVRVGELGGEEEGEGLGVLAFLVGHHDDQVALAW